MAGPITLPGIRQPIPVPDPVTGLVECNWQSPYTLNVPYSAVDPTVWTSGIYLVKLTASATPTRGERSAYITFVVRDDARQSNYLFQSAVATYEAYNVWGYRSLYPRYNLLSYPRARAYEAVKVSFNRPYENNTDPICCRSGLGAGEFLPPGWEYNMVRFLEREGYDVTYATDVDTHENPALLLSHSGLIDAGHSEYWSYQMRENVQNARDHGVSLAFFSSNDSYWQIRFEPSLVTGALDRTIVCYKTGQFEQDPITGPLQTSKWRDNPPNMPEAAMIGVQFCCEPATGDLIITNAFHWVFAGTGLKNGDHLTGLLGSEVDSIYHANSPVNIVRLATSPAY